MNFLPRTLRAMPRLAMLPLALLLLFASGPAHAQEMAITFDDLPAHGPLPPGVSRLASELGDGWLAQAQAQAARPRLDVAGACALALGF